ncbi:MAG: RNA pyrophosphohydrolase [Alphaproteobacteria bacterium]|jgi:putative (di)nucleoside polyphosphate hydrolase|nr:RNA pyrophosphohydrolase [Alphaproteobacteria bacterium]
MTSSDSSAFRLGVGIMLVNADKKVFVGRRIDQTRQKENDIVSKVWQMPQGGIDSGEHLKEALWREMDEEIGCSKGEIIAESKEWYSYDLPLDLQIRLWGGRFQGQKQKWFLVKFLGEEKDINLNTHYPEFSSWKWVDCDELIDIIVPFKKELYKKIVGEFKWYFE